MTTVTAELIDNVYDAITLMSLFAQRLSEGEISDNEAGEMSWMLGSAKKRLEPVIMALEEVEHSNDREFETLTRRGEEAKNLHGKLQRPRESQKEAAE